MKNTIVLSVMLCLSTLLPQMAFAQPVKLSANCGDVLEGEFKNSVESQDIEISMNVGDSFEMMTVPTGDELKIRAELFDPANAPVQMDEPTDLMFSDETIRSVTINVGPVAVAGMYRIRLSNSMGDKPDKVGGYNAYFKCLKQNGDIIKPKY